VHGLRHGPAGSRGLQGRMLTRSLPPSLPSPARACVRLGRRRRASSAGRGRCPKARGEPLGYEGTRPEPTGGGAEPGAGERLAGAAGATQGVRPGGAARRCRGAAADARSRRAGRVGNALMAPRAEAAAEAARPPPGLRPGLRPAALQGRGQAASRGHVPRGVGWLL
jgi:hypothetical protein